MRPPSVRRSLGWLGVLALAALSVQLAPERAPRPPTLAARLLGPIGALAASVQWVRFDAALDAGRRELAYARAALALELDPGGSEGWIHLASHFVFARASSEAEPDPARRAAWIRAGLDLLERGEHSAREPAELALRRGLVLSLVVAESDPPVAWPGGPPAAYREAALAFTRAATLGHPSAPDLADWAREAALRAGGR